VLTLHGDPHHAHEVIGETDSRKDSLALESNVERALIRVVTLQLRRLHRHQPHDGERTQEHLRETLLQYFLLRVPATSFKQDSLDEGAIFGFLGGIDGFEVRDHLEVELDVVDGDLVFTGVVLLDTREEGLSEMESTDPEDGRCAVVNPVLEALKTFNQVLNVGGERLDRVVTPFLPGWGHQVILETTSNYF